MTGRSAFTARPARLDDLDALVRLCLAARDEASASMSGLPPEPDRVRGYLLALFGEAGAHVTVVSRQDDVVGLMLSRTVPPGPFVERPRIQIEGIFVERSSRRKGAGHALLGWVAQEAADAKALDVICLPLVGARSLPRFLARIGFAPAGSHRLIATEVLARRVMREPAVVAGQEERRRGLEELIARRRRTRDTGEIPRQLYPPVDGDEERIRHVKRAVATRRSVSSP